MFRQSFRAVNASVLATGTAKTECQTRESAFDVAGNVEVSQCENVRKERLDLASAFKKVDDGRVFSGYMGEFGESSRIGDGTTVEHIAATVTRFVGGISFEERERLNENVKHDSWSFQA